MEDPIVKLIQLKNKGYCCSQILMMLDLTKRGRTNDDLVRSLGGLCYGVYLGEVCGALSGGAALISLYAGKGSDAEVPHEYYKAMLIELAQWFKEEADAEYGGVRCDDILEKFPKQAACGRIMTTTYDKCLEILANHGIGPAPGENG